MPRTIFGEPVRTHLGLTEATDTGGTPVGAVVPHRPWDCKDVGPIFDWGARPVGRRPGDVFVLRVDKTLPTFLGCIESMLRRLGSAPTYLLTDNERTVTMDRGAGVGCATRW
jgi:hypothetical protein